MAVNRYILSAIKKKDVEKALQLMLTPGYEVNADYSSAKITKSPLINATRLGLLPVVDKLISLGVDVNLPDKEKKTALHHACKKGGKELIQLLLRAGANKYQSNEHGDQPIHEAVINGNIPALEEILLAGVNVDSRNTITKYTPLHLAVLYEQELVLEFLLQNGANPNLATTKAEGEVALHYVVQVKRPAMVSILTQYGADINIMNSEGETAFAIAVQQGSFRMARTLVCSGCNMNKYRYMSPLTTACLQNNHQLIKYLLSEGYDVSKDCSFEENIFMRLEDTNPDLLEFICYRCVNPISLKESCRLFLRRFLPERIENVVPKLELPKQVQAFVISDIIY